MALVTYQDQVCELLGMVRGFGGRLFFALREPDGTVVCASGREVFVYSAKIYPFPQRRPASVAVPSAAPLRMPPPVNIPPAGGGALSNYGDV